MCYASLVSRTLALHLDAAILLEQLIDPITIPKLFENYVDSLKWADSEAEVMIIQTLHLIFNNVNGKDHLLKNPLMVNYAATCLAKEDVVIANEAAALLIDLMQDPSILISPYMQIRICRCSGRYPL